MSINSIHWLHRGHRSPEQSKEEQEDKERKNLSLVVMSPGKLFRFGLMSEFGHEKVFGKDS